MFYFVIAMIIREIGNENYAVPGSSLSVLYIHEL